MSAIGERDLTQRDLASILDEDSAQAQCADRGAGGVGGGGRCVGKGVTLIDAQYLHLLEGVCVC
jgi:hypothetical protein